MSVPQPSGDLTSPSTYMNNTHTGLFNNNNNNPAAQHQHQHSGAQQLLLQQDLSHQHYQGQAGSLSPGSAEQQDQLNLNSMQQHQQYHHHHAGLGAGDENSSMMHAHAAAGAGADYSRSLLGGGGGGGGAGGGGGGLGGLHEPDALHPASNDPLMMSAADSLLSQGSTDLCGLGEGYGDGSGGQHSHHHAQQHVGSSFGAAAAGGPSRMSFDMPDALNATDGAGGMSGMHHTGSPQLHTGSHSPGLSHFGGNSSAMPLGHESYTAESLKPQQQQQQNGTQAPQQQQRSKQQQQSQQQQQRQAQQQPRQSQAQQRQQGYASSSRAGSSSAAAAAAAGGGGGGDAPAQPVFRSQYRGVSYDKKKRKWRVQIKVAALGKSGVSVGYFDTEDAAARAYDRAAIGLLGRQNCKAVLNFPIEEYDNDSVPELVGKSREEVKATLKSERAKLPRRRLTHRRRTSRFLGVGSSNRKNQWQARILYHGKVTHLGYYRTEEEAARVYDKVSISLHGAGAQTNFPIDQYKHEVGSLQQKLSGLTREELQRALGVKPMDKSSRYRGVSKKKGRWEAKVMLNRKWAYREMFDTETEAARAYDTALWRLKPREARNYANFKDTCPPDVAEVLAALDKDSPLAMHPTGLPLTAKPLIDAGLLYDDEGQSIRAPNGLTRSVSIGDLISVGDSAGQSVSEEPSAGNGSAGRHPLSGDGASGGAVGAVAGAGGAEGITSFAGPALAAGMAGTAGMVKSASYSALSGLDGAVTSNLAAGPLTDPAAAAAAPVPLSSLPASARSALRGELTHVHLQPMHGDHVGGFGGHAHHHQQHHHHMGMSGSSFGAPSRGLGGMPRVQSVPQLHTYGSDAGSPTLPPLGGGGSGPAGHGALGLGSGSLSGLPAYGSSGGGSGPGGSGGGYGGVQYEQQHQWMGGMPPQQHQQQQAQHAAHHHQQQQHQMSAFAAQQQQPPMQGSSMGALKSESAYWTPAELSYPLQDHSGYHQLQPQHHHGMRASRSCGNLAFMANSSGGMGMGGGMNSADLHFSGHGVHSPPAAMTSQPYGSSSGGGAHADFAAETKPLMVRVGSEQHLLNPNPNPPGGFKGLSRIASESHLSSMVPLSPGHQQFLGPERGLLDAPGYGGGSGAGGYHQQHQHSSMHGYGGAGSYGGAPMGGAGAQYSSMGGPAQHTHQQQHQQSMYQMGSSQAGSYALGGGSSGSGIIQQQHQHQQQHGMQQLQPGSLHISMGGSAAPGGSGGMPPLSPVNQQQQGGAGAAGSSAAAGGGGAARVLRSSSSGGMNRAHSAAALESIDETAVFRLQQMRHDAEGQMTGRGHSMPGTLGALPPMSSAPACGGGSYGAPQQQQQQLSPPAGMSGGFGGAGGAPGTNLPPISTALPVPQDAHQQHQHQQQYGQQQQQQPMLHSNFGGPSASALHMAQAGAGGGNGTGMYGVSGGSAGMGSAAGGPTGSAAAAAAAFSAMSAGDDKWGVLGPGQAPDSPLGAVQIGGEELDVTMAFLTEHSPRHNSDGALDINGLLTDPTGLNPPNDMSGLFGGSGAATGDKMDE